MAQAQTGIQVKYLQQISSLSNSAQIMALTDVENNIVNLINLGDLMNVLRGIRFLPITPLGEISGNVNLQNNSIYSAKVVGNTTFILPSVTEEESQKYNQIIIQIEMPTVKDIQLNTNNSFYNEAITFTSAGLYNIYYEYDVNAQLWVVGAIYKGVKP